MPRPDRQHGTRVRLVSAFLFVLSMLAAPDARSQVSIVVVQSRATQPVSFILLKGDGSACGRVVNISPGNAVTLQTCGPGTMIGLNTGQGNVTLPVTPRGIYEIFPDNGRWNVRPVPR
jgi:hypothetical protein